MGTTANSYQFKEVVAYQSEIPVSTGDENIGFLVRIEPETLLLEINGTVNSAPDSELIIQSEVYARTSYGKNRFGITTRAVRIKRLVGASPLQFYLERVVPWLQNNLEATLNEASPPSISYQGQTDWIYVNTRPEKVGAG